MCPLAGSSPVPPSVAHTLQRVDNASMGGRCQIRNPAASGDRRVYNEATDRFDDAAGALVYDGPFKMAPADTNAGTPQFGEAQAIIQRWAATIPVEDTSTTRRPSEVEANATFTIIDPPDPRTADLVGRPYRVAELDTMASVLSGRLLILDENAAAAAP